MCTNLTNVVGVFEKCVLLNFDGAQVLLLTLYSTIQYAKFHTDLFSGDPDELFIWIDKRTDSTENIDFLLAFLVSRGYSR